MTRWTPILAGCFLLACSDGATSERPAGSAGSAGAAGSAGVGGAGGSAGTATGGGGSAGASAGTGGGGTSAGGGSAGSGGTGGTAGSAGSSTVDPLSTDRDEFFGSSRCAALGALFCDGFESATIDDTSWEKNGGGTASVDTSQHARGNSSLHVHTSLNGFSYLKLTKIFPVANNAYYGRMFVRFDALPTSPTWAHWTIVEAAGTGDGSAIRVGGQLDETKNRFGVGTDGGPTGDWTNLDQDPNDSPIAPPEDEWLCIEWHHDGSSDETEFWWDATQHESLSTTSSSHGGNDVPYVMPEFQSVWVGWWLYQENPMPAEYDVWIDEVALDDARIGCVR